MQRMLPGERPDNANRRKGGQTDMESGRMLLERCLALPRATDLSLADTRQVEAALAWLDLGNAAEAKAELQLLSAQCREHAEVLRAWYLVCEASHDWQLAVEVGRTICHVFPESSYGWNQLSFALHQVNRTGEAYEVLLPVAHKFPQEPVIPYNLACYSCRLGKSDEAWEWFLKAVKIGGKKELAPQALEDTDLQPLWPQISAL